MVTDYVCIDSETCGLLGPIVLFQYGEGDDGPINLYSPMREPIGKTIDLYKWLTTKRILGFNLAFDWFKVCQQATTLMLLGKRVGLDALPIDHVDEYALCEPAARDGPCFKPLGAMDLMLHARKGPWQNLMNRDPISVRRVPVQIAHLVKAELEKKVTSRIPDIFFAKRKRTGDGRWTVKQIKTAAGINPDFVHLELDFSPASSLKALATQELKLDPMKTLVFSDVEVDEKFLPKENGFAPFALSVGKLGRWNGAWPDVIARHDAHWAYNDLAREYATKDIVYPRALYAKWGRPPFDDVDSLLACEAGAVRWKGYAVDIEGIKQLRDEAAEKMKLAPRAPAQVMSWLQEVMNPVEAMILVDKKTGGATTKKVVLEEVLKTFKRCLLCESNQKHDKCVPSEHPAVERAKLVLDSRKGKKEVEIYDKLLLAKRFHVSVNVIGTRSSRQSGGQVTEGKKRKKSPGLNPQGIQKKKTVREKFPLAFTPQIVEEVCLSLREAIGRLKPGRQEPLATDEWTALGYPLLSEKLVGGDFDKFEVCIADAYYEDPQLHKDLTDCEPPCDHGECKYSNWNKDTKQFEPFCSKCTGKPSKPGSIKIHAVIGSIVYRPLTYWEVRATDGKDRDGDKKKGIPGLAELFPNWRPEHWVDLYTRAKSAFFALIYFGDARTLASRLGIPEVDGQVAYDRIMERYPVMAAKREVFHERFCPLRQPDGGQVYWVDPDDYVESMLGFKRFFTLENEVIKALYDLAEDVPPEWRNIKVKVMRREKMQTMAGAVRSALYGAAYGLQGSNKRAAGNHVIQSTGAQLTKELQCLIWEYQPIGVHSWMCRPMNVHDELPTAVLPELEERVAKTQGDFIAHRKSLVPLLGMKWKAMGTWAGK